MKRCKKVNEIIFGVLLINLIWVISCADKKQNISCVCYIYENGVQTRIDESVIIQDNSPFSQNKAGKECESKSYFTYEDNYSICQPLQVGNDPND